MMTAAAVASRAPVALRRDQPAERLRYLRRNAGKLSRVLVLKTLTNVTENDVIHESLPFAAMPQNDFDS